MRNLRCRCGKIICQTNGGSDMLLLNHEEEVILIKCRHCKRFVVIHTKGVTKIEYMDASQVARAVQV